LTNLTSLTLSINNIGEEGAKALANGNLTNLTSLRLYKSNIGEEGAKALANGNLTNLTSLTLSINNIGDEGAKALANGNLTNLTSLTLWDKNVGEEGAKAFIKALNDSKFPKLIQFLFDFNNVSTDVKEMLDLALTHNVDHSRQVNKNKVSAIAITLATIAIPAALIAHFVFQASLLVTGTIAVIGACCLVAAAATYCFNKPSNSLKNSDAEVVTNKGHAVA
ncbi:TomO hydrophobic C-terminal domain-containing protein, partial [Wolbachia endosymbiont of Laodelphax striatellus]